MITPLPIVWPSDGLIPAVIQDADTHGVLMVGFMNEEALERTRSTGFVHFWSRSRQKLWKKGETSGHVQKVKGIFINCEQNSLLIEVAQHGAVCHDGYPTCYYRRLEPDNSLQTIRDRWFDPQDVYDTGGQQATTRLWWGAYEYLRDNDLSAESGTSRRLREDTSLVPRIQDELRELAGVLDHTHTHTSQRADLLLEASQVCYWIATELVRQGVSFEDVRPDRAMDVSPEDAASPITVAKLARGAADDLDDGIFVPTQGHALFTLVASSAVSIGLTPMDILARDLDDLRGRDYLASYFAR